VRDVVQAVRDGDWNRYAELHHPDVQYSSPTAECKGVGELIERDKAFVAAVPDWTVRILNMTVDPRARLAVYEAVARGTHTGTPVSPYGGRSAAGEPFELLSANFVEFDEVGRAKAIRTYFKGSAPKDFDESR
jgi:hypothetical protein